MLFQGGEMTVTDLTAREQRVLQLLSTGKSNKQIGVDYCQSPKGISKNVSTFLILAMLMITAPVYALDSQQIRNREFERSPIQQPLFQVLMQVQTKDRQGQLRRDGERPAPDTSSVRSQLPQVQSVSMDQLRAQTDGFQSEAPAEYQYQPLQSLTTQQVDSFQTEDAMPENPVEEEQNQQIVEAIVEAELQTMEETTGEEQPAAHAVEGKIEYRIIEENNRIVVLQVEATNNYQTQ